MDSAPLPFVYSAPYVIDGHPLRLQIARLDVASALAFDRNYRMLERIYNRNALDLRAWRARYDAAFPDPGPEVEWLKSPDITDPNFAIYAEQVSARERWSEARNVEASAYRDLHESDADREARTAREGRDDAWAVKFLTDALTHYVRLEPGQTAQGQEVSTGQDLIDLYASRIGVLFDLIQVIRVQNVWSEDAKKKWALRFGFVPSSAPSTETANGDAPATTAESANPSAPVSAEPVTA